MAEGEAQTRKKRDDRRPVVPWKAWKGRIQSQVGITRWIKMKRNDLNLGQDAGEMRDPGAWVQGLASSMANGLCFMFWLSRPLAFWVLLGKCH